MSGTEITAATQKQGSLVRVLRDSRVFRAIHVVARPPVITALLICGVDVDHGCECFSRRNPLFFCTTPLVVLLLLSLRCFSLVL